MDTVYKLDKGYLPKLPLGHTFYSIRFHDGEGNRKRTVTTAIDSDEGKQSFKDLHPECRLISIKKGIN